MAELINSNNFTNKYDWRTATRTGYDLKMVALVTMLIDHVGAVLLWRYIVASHGYDDVVLMSIYEITRYIGRMAFPIYCFLLVEGFLHTRSVGKYALRLGIFALISEVPFDLATGGKLWIAEYNNVFFTLLIGLLLLWGISKIELFYQFWKEKKLDFFIGTLLALSVAVLLIVPAIFAAEVFLASDYGMGGVLAILAMYMFRQYPVVGYVMATILLYIFAGPTQILALVMLFPLSKYDGTRGSEQNGRMKYVFYWFYPVHLLVLGLLCIVLGI